MCENGSCVYDSSGNTCQGTSCCAPGLRCNNGYCNDSDPTCNAIEHAYLGPILTFEDIVSRVYNLLYPAVILFGILMIVRSGYCFMTSQGNPGKTKECQEQLSAAIIGILFVLLSVVIIRVIIGSILGL